MPEGAADELVKAIEKYVSDYKLKFTKQGKDQLPNLEKFPMDSVLPMALIYYGSQLAENISFEPPFITMGASVSHFGLLTDK